MTTWRWIAGALTLSLLLFMTLFAVAPSSADESVDKSTLLGTPRATTPAAEPPSDPSDGESTTSLTDWANVRLQHNRESYLVDDPNGAASAPQSAEPMPAPVQPAPAEAPAPGSEVANTIELATYTVRSGDNLFRIARRHGVSLETLAAFNNVSEPGRLSVGQVLRIPNSSATSPSTIATKEALTTSSVYVVRAGDIPYRIARRFGIPVQALVAANNITDPSDLQIGQQLVIPSSNATAIAPPPTSSATSQATAVPTGEAKTYVIQAGDIPYRIARRFGISVQALMAANNITDPGDLQIGQQLVIPAPGTTVTPPPPTPTAAVTATAVPAGETTTYTVQAGDNPYRIARRFDISVRALLVANNITNPSSLQIGQQLVIPPPGTTPTPPPAPANVPTEPGGFIWPVESRHLYQYYRYGHRAIDIDVAVGTPVVAAAAGTVEFSGWNAYGYGYLVVVDHGNGFRTLYAHNSSLKVEKGQKVAQGDLISLSGSTGYSTAPHVHFEIIENSNLVDPCSYLPGGC